MLSRDRRVSSEMVKSHAGFIAGFIAGISGCDSYENCRRLINHPRSGSKTAGKKPRTNGDASEFNRYVVGVCDLAFSLVWDTPTGPTIVVSAASFFVVSQVFHSVRK